MRPVVKYMSVISLMLLMVINTPSWSTEISSDDSVLEASSIVLSETSDGYILELVGSVRILISGDKITADNATATLGMDLTSISEAVEYIELSGNVSFEGRDGTSGWSDSATWYAAEERIKLEGSPGFRDGKLQITAGVVDYSIAGSNLNLSGGVRLVTGTYTASCNSCYYKTDNESGSLSGNVEIRYKYGESLVCDERIEEIIFKSGALYISMNEGRISTPEGNEASRTTIDAGCIRLESDTMAFTARDNKVVGIIATGDAVGSGDELRLESRRISIQQGTDPDAYSINASSDGSGVVKFMVYDQEGTCDSIEVNHNRGWSIRIVGGSIEGEVPGEQVDDIFSGENSD